MLSVLGQRNFALFWFGQILSRVGDWMLFIALPFYVLELTGSALATGAMFMVQTLPVLLLGSLAGVFVDRWDRRRTLIVTDLLRAPLLLLLLTVRSIEWLWLIYLVAFIESAISQFFVPAKNAIIPRLVGEKDLMAANSLNAVSDNVARLVGPSLGGALLGLLGLASVVLVDTTSYLISGAMIFLIFLPPDPAGEQAKTAATSTTWTTVWQDWLEGLRLVKKERLLTALFIVTGIGALAEGIISVLLVVFVKDMLRRGALEFGWIMTARGIGGLMGGLFIAQVGRGLEPRRLIALGAGTAGLIFLAMINFPSLLLALGLVVLVGVPAMGFMVSTQTLLQTSVADHYRGRIFGAFGTTVALLTLAGMGLASALGDVFGVVPMLDVAGVLFLLAGLLALVMFRAPR